MLSATLLIAANLFAPPGADEPSPGFTLCVAPRPPHCVDAPGKSDPIEDCEHRVRGYVENVARYRKCLQAETERQVRRANETLDKLNRKQSEGRQ